MCYSSRAPESSNVSRVSGNYSRGAPVKSTIVAFLVAMATSGLLKPIVRALAMRPGPVSSPGRRHLQKRGGTATRWLCDLRRLRRSPVGLSFIESAVAKPFRFGGSTRLRSPCSCFRHVRHRPLNSSQVAARSPQPRATRPPAPSSLLLIYPGASVAGCRQKTEKTVSYAF